MSKVCVDGDGDGGGGARSGAVAIKRAMLTRQSTSNAMARKELYSRAWAIANTRQLREIGRREGSCRNAVKPAGIAQKEERKW